MKLQFIIDAKNRTDAAYKKVQGNMDKVSDKLKAHRKAFKAMAVAGVAAMGAVALAMHTTIKQAMIAEGAYNKFNAVFKEHKDDMMEFVKDIRTRMPTATHEIVIMLSGIQDLLVPMGIARGEAAGMSKNFVELANQIAAFNDVSPEEVLVAIKSGLVGSSEPLKRFGVEARITTLESVAMKEGLIGIGDTFAKLDPQTRAQVTAQALLIKITQDSADAIEGFAENQDSALRRTQDLQAGIKEAKVAIGNALLPLYDSILKKMLPIIEKMGEWIEANPELTKVILIAVGALAGLVAIIGTLGLVLPGIITLFGMLSVASLPITVAIIGIIAVIGLFIAIGWTLYKDWNAILKGYKIMLGEFKDFWIGVWQAIKDFFSDIWEGMKTVVGDAVDWLMDRIQPFIDAFERVKAGIRWIGEQAGKVGGLLEFQKGGIVPGALGQPIPAIVHGGETIIPAGMRGMGGAITVNIMGGNYLSREAATMFGKEIADELKRDLKLS